MSDTPRTDAEIDDVMPNLVGAEFARTLERELTAAIERAERAERALIDFAMCRISTTPEGEAVTAMPPGVQESCPHCGAPRKDFPGA